MTTPSTVSKQLDLARMFLQGDVQGSTLPAFPAPVDFSQVLLQGDIQGTTITVFLAHVDHPKVPL